MCTKQHDHDGHDEPGIFQRILVAVDASEPAQWAIDMATRMARANHAQLAFVHVTPGDTAMTPEFALLREDIAENHRSAGSALLERCTATVGVNAPCEVFLKIGEPSQQIIATAREWKPDVIVIGTHGRGAVGHMMLGSTAESVVRHSYAPVLPVGCPAAQAKKAGSCAGTCGCGKKSALQPAATAV